MYSHVLCSFVLFFCLLRLRSGDRPYQCRYCTYAAVTSSDRNKHEWLHTGERPYKCLQCDYTSTRSDKLKNHMWSKHGVEATKVAKQTRIMKTACADTDSGATATAPAARVSRAGKRTRKPAGVVDDGGFAGGVELVECVSGPHKYSEKRRTNEGRGWGYIFIYESKEQLASFHSCMILEGG